METLIKWAITLAIVAGVIFGVVKAYEWWRSSVHEEGVIRGRAEVQQKWDTDVRKRDKEKLDAISRVRLEEREDAQKVVQGERDAREKAEKRAAAYAAAASTARASDTGLRDTIAQLDRLARERGIPDAAACPGEFVQQRDAAVRGRSLLDACSTRYRELAESSDRAWEAVNLKLDTAIGYINAVAPK